MSKKSEPALVSREEVYRGRIVDLVVDQVEIAGKPRIREVVRHPGGVVVLGVRSDGRIPFVNQHRYPMDRNLLELPAGKVDPGEPPELTASREMEEETGYRPTRLRRILRFYSSPGFCDELLHFFFSERLQEGRPNPDEDEEIEVRFLTLAEALELAERDGIQDAKTLVAIYWLAHRERTRGAP